MCLLYSLKRQIVNIYLCLFLFISLSLLPSRLPLYSSRLRFLSSLFSPFPCYPFLPSSVLLLSFFYISYFSFSFFSFPSFFLLLFLVKVSHSFLSFSSSSNFPFSFPFTSSLYLLTFIFPLPSFSFPSFSSYSSLLFSFRLFAVSLIHLL